MKKDLPRSLDVANLLSLPLPGDTTLGVARAHFKRSDVAAALSAHAKDGRTIRIRFVLRTEPETEAPDAMTLAEFQGLCEAGRAFISVDDKGQGGVRTSDARPRELV